MQEERKGTGRDEWRKDIARGKLWLGDRGGGGGKGGREGGRDGGRKREGWKEGKGNRRGEGK